MLVQAESQDTIMRRDGSPTPCDVPLIGVVPVVSVVPRAMPQPLGDWYSAEAEAEDQRATMLEWMYERQPLRHGS